MYNTMDKKRSEKAIAFTTPTISMKIGGERQCVILDPSASDEEGALLKELILRGYAVLPLAPEGARIQPALPKKYVSHETHTQ